MLPIFSLHMYCRRRSGDTNFQIISSSNSFLLFNFFDSAMVTTSMVTHIIMFIVDFEHSFHPYAARFSMLGILLNAYIINITKYRIRRPIALFSVVIVVGFIFQTEICTCCRC